MEQRARIEGQPAEGTEGPRLATGTPGRERGFTFIEVLVVMGIIAVLAGMSVLVIQLMAKKKPLIRTQTRIAKVSATIGSWQRKFGRYPPTDPRRLQRTAGGAHTIKKVPNTFNEGIEAVFQALYWDTFGEDPQLSDDALGNTDEDDLDEAATRQGKMLFEVIDGWGNPLVYFSHTEYARADSSPPSYLLANGEEVFPRPWKYQAEGRTGFAQPNSFQVFSMGPDEQPNTDDDVKSW
ncbi:MAG: type II secretion system protein [Planctomycetota bacterium]